MLSKELLDLHGRINSLESDLIEVNLSLVHYVELLENRIKILEQSVEYTKAGRLLRRMRDGEF